MDIENDSSFVGCSASRTSLAIMPDLTILPCSFVEARTEQDNLRTHNLNQIWNDKNFHDFRHKIHANMESPLYSKCSAVDTCLGG